MSGKSCFKSYVDDDLDIRINRNYSLSNWCVVTWVLHFPIVHLSVGVCSWSSSVCQRSAGAGQNTGRTSTCVQDDDTLTGFVLRVVFWICRYFYFIITEASQGSSYWFRWTVTGNKCEIYSLYYSISMSIIQGRIYRGGTLRKSCACPKLSHNKHTHTNHSVFKKRHISQKV